MSIPTEMKRVKFGPLDCLVVAADRTVESGPANPGPVGSGPADSPSAASTPPIRVILCHGYGAPGDDLAGLAEPLIGWLGDRASSFEFIFPQAPHDLANLGMPDGRAWWPLNMAALQELLQTSQFEQLHESVPPGLSDAHAALVQCIRAVCGIDGEIAAAPYVLGGFSQGAMLTMDVAIRGDVPPPKLLVQFSGTLICRSQWTDMVDRLASTDVLQSHGRFDPILPFTSGMALRDLLIGHDVPVEFVAFDGPHTIEPNTLMKLVTRLGAMVP